MKAEKGAHRFRCGVGDAKVVSRLEDGWVLLEWTTSGKSVEDSNNRWNFAEVRLWSDE